MVLIVPTYSWPAVLPHAVGHIQPGALRGGDAVWLAGRCPRDLGSCCAGLLAGRVLFCFYLGGLHKYSGFSALRPSSSLSSSLSSSSRCEEIITPVPPTSDCPGHCVYPTSNTYSTLYTGIYSIYIFYIYPSYISLLSTTHVCI